MSSGRQRDETKIKPSPAPTEKTAPKSDLKKVNATNNVASKGEKIKKRYWRFELYPESLPEGWLEFLRNSCIEFALSPLHDKDVYTKDVRSEDDTDLVQGKVGERKKPHYHGIFAFSGPTTFDNVYKTLLEPLKQPIPLSCDNVRRAYEYFWHKNDPDKYQYNKDDVQVFNGFDILNYINIEQNRILEIKLEIVELIKSKPVLEAIDMLDDIREAFADKDDLIEYLDVAFSNTAALNIYIRSNRHKFEKNPPKPSNEDMAALASQAAEQG